MTRYSRYNKLGRFDILKYIADAPEDLKIEESEQKATCHVCGELVRHHIVASSFRLALTYVVCDRCIKFDSLESADSGDIVENMHTAIDELKKRLGL
jgi:hypothetical protein